MSQRASVMKSMGSGGHRTLATRVEALERRMAAQEKREKVRDEHTSEKFALLTERVSGVDTRLGLLVEKVSAVQSRVTDTWDCMDQIRKGQEKSFAALDGRLDAGLDALHKRLNTLGCAPAADKEDRHGT